MFRKTFGLLNRITAPFGVSVIPSWKVQWWTMQRTFQFNGRDYPCFVHSYNCGWPPYSSERCVELALADAWLSGEGSEDVVEIGAVTPYYWPRRVRTVVDPCDIHPQVTMRHSLFREDLREKNVLSISTFEHIGTGEYGVAENVKQVDHAFAKLFDESPRFLVTVPTGYNDRVDSLLSEPKRIPNDVNLGFLVRDGSESWREETDRSKAIVPYGDALLQKRFAGTCVGKWANGVAVFERGGKLAGRSCDTQQTT